ncbi:hypothetical protein, partial [Methylobacterium sp. yr596]|uniref:hypothetical protein n=2 Tax=Methylobacterium TaxID=407 RepID=UPI0011135D17
MFGLAARESFPVTVKGFEAIEDFAARLTLIDHAAEIEAMVDAVERPRRRAGTATDRHASGADHRQRGLGRARVGRHHPDQPGA